MNTLLYFFVYWLLWIVPLPALLRQWERANERVTGETRFALATQIGAANRLRLAIAKMIAPISKPRIFGLLLCLALLLALSACSEADSRDFARVQQGAVTAVESTLAIVEGQVPQPTRIEVTEGELAECSALSRVHAVSPSPFGSLCQKIAWAEVSGIPVVVVERH